jgi:hypothetical protein
MLCLINNREMPRQAKRGRPTPSDIQPDIRFAATLAANRVPFDDVAFALVLAGYNARRCMLLTLMPVLIKRASHHHFRFVAAMGAGTHLFE